MGWIMYRFVCRSAWQTLRKKGLQLKGGQFDSDEQLLATVESIDFRQRRLQPGNLGDEVTSTGRK